MEYAKLQGAFMRSPRFKDADMAARGAWTTLVGHCADQENGGRIAACRAWNDRQWLSRTDCLLADVEVAIAAELARWEGDDLLVIGYDAVSEQAFHDLSAKNRNRAITGWEKRRADHGAAAGNDAAGKTDRSQRHDAALPPAMPRQGDGMPPASKSDANNRPNNRTTDRDTTAASPPPPMGVADGARPKTRATTPPAVPVLRDPELGSYESNLRRSREARSLVDRLRHPELVEHLERAADDIRQAAATLLADESNAWLATDELAAVRRWMTSDLAAT